MFVAQALDPARRVQHITGIDDFFFERTHRARGNLAVVHPGFKTRGEIVLLLVSFREAIDYFDDVEKTV